MKKHLFTTAVILFLSTLLSFAGNNDEVIMPDMPKHKKYVDLSRQEKGFWCAVDLAAGPSLSLDKGHKPSWAGDALFTFGYRVNNFIQAGLGCGIRYYFEEGTRTNAKNLKPVSIPLFANVRGVMMEPRGHVVVPFWSMNVGYAVFDGFYLSPTVGIRVGSMERSHFTAGIAYVLQGASTKNNDDSVKSNGILNSLQLKLGYQF